MKTNELINTLIEMVYAKGSYKNTFVQDSENGLKAISLKKGHYVDGMEYPVYDICVYVNMMRPEFFLLVVCDGDDDTMTYDGAELTDETLISLIDLVEGVDMATETWNYHKKSA